MIRPWADAGNVLSVAEIKTKRTELIVPSVEIRSRPNESQRNATSSSPGLLAPGQSNHSFWWYSIASSLHASVCQVKTAQNWNEDATNWLQRNRNRRTMTNRPQATSLPCHSSRPGPSFLSYPPPLGTIIANGRDPIPIFSQQLFSLLLRPWHRGNESYPSPSLSVYSHIESLNFFLITLRLIATWRIIFFEQLIN